MEALFKVENLRVQFSTRVGTLHAVNGVSFQIKEGLISPSSKKPTFFPEMSSGV